MKNENIQRISRRYKRVPIQKMDHANYSKISMSIGKDARNK